MSQAPTPPTTGPAKLSSRPRRVRLLMKQPNMLRVIYALIPVAVAGVYFFGWRVVAILAAVNAAGLITEGIMSRRRGQPISMACLVTCWLYALSLPPTVPFWIAAVGVVAGVLFGKEVFGGFGRNFANPAIVGRAFVYICFPVPLTARFVPAFRGWPGGLGQWSMEHFLQATGRLPEYLASKGATVAEAVSQATPMWVNREFGEQVRTQGASLWEMFLGNMGGTFQAAGQTRVLSAGSIGEGCALLIILAGVYLMVTKTANWRLTVSSLAGLAFATGLFRHLLGFGGLGGVPPLAFTLLAGTTLYVSVFMVTDPVSAPKRRGAQYAYGFLIGLLIVFLRWRGVFVAAASFAVLLGNIVGPLLDEAAVSVQKRKRAGKAGPAKEADE